MIKKIHIFTSRNIIILLFLIFLFLRLFVSFPTELLTADNLKFFEASRNFPNHALYNDQLYLLHPPFYPYTIHFFTLIFQNEYIAAIFISIISSIITFFALYNFFMMLTRSFILTFFALFFLTLSSELIISSRIALRESFVIMLIISSIYFYVKGVKFDDKKSVAYATIIGSILAVTSDHVVFLFPALMLSYLFFNSKKPDFRKFFFPNLRYLILPLFFILLLYGSWTYIKFYQYSDVEYYPNGYEGTPVNTQDLGLFQLISPQNFDDYRGTYIKQGIISTLKRVAFNFGYMFNMEPFSIPRGLNFTTMQYLLHPRHTAYMFVIYLPLALIALFAFLHTILDFARTKQVHNNVNLFIIALLLVFAIPVTQKFASPRYILTSYIFLYYLISYGTVLLLQRKWKSQLHKIIPVTVVLLLLLVPFWHYHNNHFVFFTSSVVASQKTGDFINANIPKEANLMVQPGYAVKLIYLTGNKIVGLHHDPQRLDYLIDYYNISYIVFGRYYTWDALQLSRESAEYILNKPDKFRLVATVEEDYTQFRPRESPASTDEVYIYQVLGRGSLK